MSVCNDDVRSVVYDDDNIVRAIKERPQSYHTLLGDSMDNGTYQCVLRRRARRLIKESRVFRIRVPGTRFGLVMFLHPDRDYILITKNSSIGVNVYYCYDLEEDDKYVFLNNYWELKGPRWSRWEPKTNPLKLLKSDSRDGGVLVW